MRLSNTLQAFCEKKFVNFPWQIVIKDFTGNTFGIGQNKAHWYQCPLYIYLHTPKAVKSLLRLDGFSLVEQYIKGDIDFEGNFYILTSIKDYVPIDLNTFQFIKSYLSNRLFQNIKRAKINVSSHYDIPQALLELYLDKKYMAYSCAMFEETELNLTRLEELSTPGLGANDSYDSLEKAQYRKFKDAVDFIKPAKGESLLDIGCGYGGQLLVALENQPFGKVVGWTHSHNQVQFGQKFLAKYDSSRWELNEGDYREDPRIYDHISSTGMISHVGPKGLQPYVRNIRNSIKSGGRYVHHALMANYSPSHLDKKVGIAFNKKYVWPGFHWFTLGEHVAILESNGFKIIKVLNLKDQYTKTITAWYERMMHHKGYMIEQMGEPTFRAWRLYLGGGAGPQSGDINRIYCVAV
jgi:cyclopropane-fatty-acyl-phospholipid synthase